MTLTNREFEIVNNLLKDKIDICERHIKKFEKDYKYYTEDRAKWIPGEKLGSPDSAYAKEIERQIQLEKNKISEYLNIVLKLSELDSKEDIE